MSLFRRGHTPAARRGRQYDFFVYAPRCLFRHGDTSRSPRHEYGIDALVEDLHEMAVRLSLNGRDWGGAFTRPWVPCGEGMGGPREEVGRAVSVCVLGAVRQGDGRGRRRRLRGAPPGRVAGLVS